MKKFLFSLISLFIIVKLLYVAIINRAITTTFVFCPFMSKQITLNFLILLVGTFIAGIVFILCLNCLKNKGKSLNAYKNQYEKIAVANEEQSDKVKILEEKIKALEIALSKALEK